MSVCTPTAIASEAHPDRAISSQRTIVDRKSLPAPPYRSSYSTPRKPSAPMRGQIDLGISPACSQASMCGSTSFWTKERTAWRNISCCSSKTFTGLVPRAPVVDLLRAFLNRPGGHHLDSASELHDVTDGRLERRPRVLGRAARPELDHHRQRILMSFASNDDLVAHDTGNACRHLVDLTRVDEHAAYLRDLVGAPSPSQHARGRAPARAALVGEHGEIAGAEPDHRVGPVVDGRHELPDLADGKRLTAPGIAHLYDRL